MQAERFGAVNPGDVQQATYGLRGIHSAQEIYALYCHTARTNKRYPGHIVAVGQILSKMGVARHKSKARVFYTFGY